MIGLCPQGRRQTAPFLEETARHAGHANILLEQIDGTTGL